jgi:hypothetical protein
MATDDPWLTERMANDAVLVEGEKRIEAAVLAAIEAWLNAARALVLGEALPLTAAGEDVPPDIDDVQGSFEVWVQQLTDSVMPAIAETFGVGFLAAARSADLSVLPWQEAHLAEVFDRLKIWPEGAFEELRPELLESLAEGESIDQTRDRIGRVLSIDAPARSIRADISVLDRRLADPLLPPAEGVRLRRERRQLWSQKDEADQQWRWLARRIARTEVQGAVEGGALAGAQAIAAETGEPMYKKWLATSDERTRRAHHVADGQIVPVGEKFRVGRSDLDHPADPRGRAEDIINCRCTMQILDADEVSEAVKGKWGGRGVSPMSARLGPDLPEEVEAAVEQLGRERKGEVVDWSPRFREPVVPDVPKPPAPSAAAPVADAVPEASGPAPRRGEFAGRSMDDLVADLNASAEAEDFDLMERIVIEVEKREAKQAKDRAKRAAAREAKEARQMADYEAALSRGLSDEDAVEEAFGIPVERQRAKNAIAFLRMQGNKGRNLEELVADAHADWVESAWRKAEDDPMVNGRFFKREVMIDDQDPFDARQLWSVSEDKLHKYASEDLMRWFDVNGRLTKAQLQAALTDPVELARLYSSGRDFNQ